MTNIKLQPDNSWQATWVTNFSGVFKMTEIKRAEGGRPHDSAFARRKTADHAPVDRIPTMCNCLDVEDFLDSAGFEIAAGFTKGCFGL